MEKKILYWVEDFELLIHEVVSVVEHKYPGWEVDRQNLVAELKRAGGLFFDLSEKEAREVVDYFGEGFCECHTLEDDDPYVTLFKLALNAARDAEVEWLKDPDPEPASPALMEISTPETGEPIDPEEFHNNIINFYSVSGWLPEEGHEELHELGQELKKTAQQVLSLSWDEAQLLVTKMQDRFSAEEYMKESEAKALLQLLQAHGIWVDHETPENSPHFVLLRMIAGVIELGRVRVEEWPKMAEEQVEKFPYPFTPLADRMKVESAH